MPMRMTPRHAYLLQIRNKAPPIVFGEYISLSALLISILLKADLVVAITVAVGIPTQ